MDPVSTNTRSKTCDNPISSDCVIVPTVIPGVSGCGNKTVTETLYAMGKTIQGTTGGSCYTGNWVDISTIMPLAGSGTGYSYTFTGLGAGGYLPMYKFTKEGDVKVRGILTLNITVSNQKGYVFLPLVTLSPSCFPAGFTANQYVLCDGDTFLVNNTIGTVIYASLFLEYPTGRLMLQCHYTTTTPGPILFNIDFGGTQFNIA